MIRNILNNGGFTQATFLMLAASICAIVVALSFHEYAHGYAAMKNGDYTAKAMGRLTLNPMKHLDVMGFLMLLVAGFGWAKPVPVNPNNFKKQRRGILTVSLAGVTMNLIIAFISFGFMALMLYFYKIFDVPNANQFAQIVFLLFFYFFDASLWINLTLFAFNLLPIYPLDGFHVVEAFTRPDNKYCVFMRKYGSLVLMGILLFSVIFGSFWEYFDIIGQYINAVAGGLRRLLQNLLGVIVKV